jgi:hypothetical protein
MCCVWLVISLLKNTDIKNYSPLIPVLDATGTENLTYASAEIHMEAPTKKDFLGRYIDRIDR